MDMSNINWLAVIGAAISAFVIGGLWYGPLFGKAWMSTTGKTPEELAKRNMPMVFGVSLLLMLIAAVNLEMFIGAEGDVSFGALAGFLAGFGWVATFFGVVYLFEARPMKAFWINAGYSIVSLTVMGAILGAW
jgi:hypothetical protein